MDEIAPGIFHWTAFRDSIGMDVHSYWIEPAGIVVDPMVPADVGLDWWDGRDVQPQQVVLTTGLHWRETPEFVERFGCEVRAAEAALERWAGDEDRSATPFDDREEIAPGVTARVIDALAPDESALLIDHGGGAIALADALMRADGGGAPLTFVPDYLMGDDPDAVKEGLTNALRAFLERDFEVLLMAHGAPIAGGARAALADFLN
jgi:AcrR family transcriptional regulator